MSEIRLTRGEIVYVDQCDYARVSVFNWRLHNRRYAARSEGRQIVFMHNLILPPRSGYRIDHINGIGTDNRRVNLRYATHTGNMRNRRKLKSGSSVWKGVSWCKQAKKWQAQIHRGIGVSPHIGFFVSEIDAARAYDAAARLRFGQFSCINFPIDGERGAHTMPRVAITRRRAKGKPGQRQSRKGGSYERLMARRLSVWVTGGKRTDCFWRTASSGGMATHRAQRGQKTQDQNTHAGDLLLTHPKGRLFLDLFMVELKHQKTFHLEQVFFDRKSSDFIRFWKDLQGKSHPLGRTPLFITKRTSMGELISTDREGVRILRLGVRATIPLRSVMIIPRHGMITFLLKDVLDSVDFLRIKKHYAA